MAAAAIKYFRCCKINSSNKEFPRERLFKNSLAIYRKAFSFISRRSTLRAAPDWNSSIMSYVGFTRFNFDDSSYSALGERMPRFISSPNNGEKMAEWENEIGRESRRMRLELVA